jgi:polyvinyl alcohol dehydrogenase (cytochrome)
MKMKYIVRHLGHLPKRAYWLLLVEFVLGLTTVAAIASYLPNQTAHAAFPTRWSTFLGSNARTGYNAAETIINPTTAPNLKLHWTASTVGQAKATDEVIVANGMLYWGSWDGLLHASDPNTGKDIWTASLGTQPGGCSNKPHGVVGSVAVARVLINGVGTSIVFVAAGQSNLYALNAHTGTILWRTNLGTNPAEFLYSSTAVYKGSVYVGVSSTGDCPLVQGEVVQVNASTGQIQHTFKIVPDGGCLGGAVWGSPTIDEQTGKLYVVTGNADKQSCTQPMPLGQAVVELNATDLSLVASWQVPSSDLVGKDDDFGSTPTLFQATINSVSHAMVGMVNKDGYYYALDRTKISAGPLWKVRISVGGSAPATDASIASSAYDGTGLYVAGSLTTIGGRQCVGSLQKLDPNTGTVLWADCLNGSVLAPTLAVPGLVVVGAGNSMDVVDSQTGRILFTYTDTTTNGDFWGAATISGGILYDESKSGKLFAFGL